MSLKQPPRWLTEPTQLFLVLLTLLPILQILLFIHIYSFVVPYGDQWRLSAPVAVATADHELTLDVLMHPDDGHRTFFTNLMLAALTATTAWDIRLEVYLSFLIPLFYFAMLVALFRPGRQTTVLMAAAAFSALIFAVSREVSWWSQRHTHWNFANLFFLLALWLIAFRPRNRANWVLAALLAACATFSSGNGMVSWPVLLIAAWLRRRLRWSEAIFWIGAAAVTLILYLVNSGIGLGADSMSEDAMSTIQPQGIETLIDFASVYLARLLSPNEVDVTYAYTVAGVGVAVFIANAIYLWTRVDLRPTIGRAAVPWLAVAGFAFGTGVLAALGREMNGLFAALQEQYLAASGLFWIALVALVLLTIQSIQLMAAAARRYERALMVGNLLALVLVAAFYVYSATSTLQDMALLWQRTLHSDDDHLRPEEQCVLDFPLTRNGRCWERIRAQSEWVDALAARRLTVFADAPETSVLPAAYEAGSPVVLATSGAWRNLHARDWLLAGVGDASIVHVLPPDEIEEVDELDVPQPLQTVVEASGVDVAALSANRQVWQVFTPRETDAARRLSEQLMEAGFTSVYAERPDVPIALRVEGYERLSQEPRALFEFANTLVLEAWQLEGPADRRPCEAITVSSLWRTDAPLAPTLSATFVLADANGVGFAQADGAPAGLATDRWQLDQLYLDRRALTIPCGTTPGAYPLLLGVYDYSNGDSITAVASDATWEGDQIYLTTINVQ